MAECPLNNYHEHSIPVTPMDVSYKLAKYNKDAVYKREIVLLTIPLGRSD